MGYVALQEIVSYLGTLLEIRDTPDYPQALNGLQFENDGRVTRIAAAVDFSLATVDAARAAGADLLVVHHGMFWAGVQPFTGRRRDVFRALLDGNIAVYSAHLPLDRHAHYGNSVLLAGELGLQPTAEFARYKTIHVGVRGESDIPTVQLFERARRFAEAHGGSARLSPVPTGHHTHRWAICTGAGANTDTLSEVAELDIDTLIVGEGPHWTAVAAADASTAIIYAGHYATETLGVQAIGAHLAQRFDIASTFIAQPTGL